MFFGARKDRGQFLWIVFRFLSDFLNIEFFMKTVPHFVFKPGLIWMMSYEKKNILGEKNFTFDQKYQDTKQMKSKCIELTTKNRREINQI